MPEMRLGLARLASIVGLSALALGIGLGSSGRLTYHEAFVAQAAREMIAGGSALVPTIDGQPWLEKPPLATWLVALAGLAHGGVTELVARTPSAVAATLLAIGVACFAARRFGRNAGWLAGLIQVTTFWLVVRGRLAEADIVLACLVTWAMVAFDRVRTPARVATIRGPHAMRLASRWVEHARASARFLPLPLGENRGEGRGIAVEPRVQEDQNETASTFSGVSTPLAPGPSPRGRGEADIAAPLRVNPAPPGPSAAWRWAFFATLGATSLAKGVGFGAVLVGSAVAATLLWDRDRSAIRALTHRGGWVLAGVLALTWPALVAIRLPSAVSLWALHVTDRLASHPEVFIGGPWWLYAPAALGQALPWTPLALVGAWPSLRRAFGSRGQGGADRLLWAWATVPLLLLSAATIKNEHYAIHALPPMAVWAALGLMRVGARLEFRRGWPARRVRLGAAALFLTLGLGSGLGHRTLGPRFDRRGSEWAWCGAIGRSLDPALPLVVLYEDWDRKPYPTPFGPMPHDWAVRLFYLERPASWRQGVDDLLARPLGPLAAPYALLARERDLPALARVGRVEPLNKGPADRFDREFTLFRVTPSGGG